MSSSTSRNSGHPGWALALAVVVLAWAVAAWAWLRPPALVADWNGWRQADTQTIARYLARPDGRLLYPRIAWGGDGPGYVESELQLYPALFAPVLRRVGPVEWPGQLVSLLLFAGSALLLGLMLRERFSPLAALLGVVSFLSTRAALHLATAVQPEALLVFLFVAAWFAFLRFERDGAWVWLVAFAGLGALAMLVKPSAAQIGIASFLLLALRSRARLRSPAVWLAWGAMVLLLLAHLAFARGIFLEYGNTFGVLSGGDSKLPKLEHLVRPGLYAGAAWIAVLWGVGPVGALCAAALAVRRRLGLEEISLLCGAAAWTLLTLRYSSDEAFGSHYPVLAGVLGAWCVAHAVRALSELEMRSRAWPAVLATSLLVQLGASWIVRRQHLHPDRGAACTLTLAALLGNDVRPGDLVVVRAGTFAYDRYWRTANNYQDPRPFYVTGTHGWVLASDEDDPSALARMVARGARAYLEPDSRYGTPAIDRWLAAHAQLLAQTPCGKAWRLSASPP